MPGRRHGQFLNDGGGMVYHVRDGSVRMWSGPETPEAFL